jgi:hypothetical protein
MSGIPGILDVPDALGVPDVDEPKASGSACTSSKVIKMKTKADFFEVDALWLSLKPRAFPSRFLSMAPYR